MSEGWTDIKIGIAPEMTQFSGDVQGQRRQYGLKHQVTSTIHAAMGDTLHSVATEISARNNQYKGQAVVLLSRTNLGKDLIFFGDKNDTIRALINLIKQRSQWSDYSDNIILAALALQQHSSTALLQIEVCVTKVYIYTFLFLYTCNNSLIN